VINGVGSGETTDMYAVVMKSIRGSGDASIGEPKNTAARP
jgi:hypothetical protein